MKFAKSCPSLQKRTPHPQEKRDESDQQPRTQISISPWLVSQEERCYVSWSATELQAISLLDSHEGDGEEEIEHNPDQKLALNHDKPQGILEDVSVTMLAPTSDCRSGTIHYRTLNQGRPRTTDSG